MLCCPVVSELEGFERDPLLHPESPCVGRVGVNVFAARLFHLGSSDRHPTRLKKFVAVGVGGEDFQIDGVDSIMSKALDSDGERWKHSPIWWGGRKERR